MTISANKLAESAKHFGADDVAIYQPADLDGHFMATQIIPNLPSRGYGFWKWKPYIILGHLKVACKEGDTIIYSDAGVEIVSNLNYLVHAMKDDIMLFTNGFEHSHWCKGDIMKAINGDYTIGYKQCQASLILFKATQKAIDFVQEWLAYCCIPGLIDDSPSKFPNAPEFAENRHDQACLTALAIKYNHPLRWFPSSTALHLREIEPYPVMLHHNRKRNNEW